MFAFVFVYLVCLPQRPAMGSNTLLPLPVSRCHPGGVSVVSSCLGGVSVVSNWKPWGVLVPSRWCFGDVPAAFWRAKGGETAGVRCC